MSHDEQFLLVDALKGMQAINAQVNLLLDGFEYLVATVSELDSSLLFQRQIKDGAQSMSELSELMIVLKKLVVSINNGVPLRQNKQFKQELISEMILHMDMIRSLLKDYEIHPEGYSAVKIAEGMICIKTCLLHY